MTNKEAKRLLRVSEPTLRRFRKDGVIGYTSSIRDYADKDVFRLLKGGKAESYVYHRYFDVGVPKRVSLKAVVAAKLLVDSASESKALMQLLEDIILWRVDKVYVDDVAVFSSFLDVVYVACRATGTQLIVRSDLVVVDEPVICAGGTA